jgi:hypothetical protein
MTIQLSPNLHPRWLNNLDRGELSVRGDQWVPDVRVNSRKTDKGLWTLSIPYRTSWLPDTGSVVYGVLVLLNPTIAVAFFCHEGVRPWNRQLVALKLVY